MVEIVQYFIPEQLTKVSECSPSIFRNVRCTICFMDSTVLSYLYHEEGIELACLKIVRPINPRIHDSMAYNSPPDARRLSNANCQVYLAIE